MYQSIEKAYESPPSQGNRHVHLQRSLCRSSAGVEGQGRAFDERTFGLDRNTEVNVGGLGRKLESFSNDRQNTSARKNVQNIGFKTSAKRVGNRRGFSDPDFLVMQGIIALILIGCAHGLWISMSIIPIRKELRKINDTLNRIVTIEELQPQLLHTPPSKCMPNAATIEPSGLHDVQQEPVVPSTGDPLQYTPSTLESPLQPYFEQQQRQLIFPSQAAYRHFVPLSTARYVLHNTENQTCRHGALFQNSHVFCHPYGRIIDI